MDAKYLTVKQAAKRRGKGDFSQNVLTAVLPRLIDQGLLNGKKEKNKVYVADDDGLARVAQLGIESFIQDQQGYSFAAVRAPIEQVATKLEARPGVVEYESNVQPEEMNDDVDGVQDEKLRETFLVQMRDFPEWTILINTVHWFHSCDSTMVTALACVLSVELKTLSAAAWDDDFSGASLIVCENGEQTKSISDEGEDEDDEDGWVEFYEFFYQQGIYLPESFIGSAPETETTKLYVTDATKVQRADRVVLKVPAAVESKGPHVFEKIGMMAEAMAEDLEDEEAFMQHMRGGVWQQAQAVLEAGDF